MGEGEVCGGRGVGEGRYVLMCEGEGGEVRTYVWGEGESEVYVCDKIQVFGHTFVAV